MARRGASKDALSSNPKQYTVSESRHVAAGKVKAVPTLREQVAEMVICTETVLISVCVCGLAIAGMATLRSSVISEISDTAKSIGAIDQSYSVAGVRRVYCRCPLNGAPKVSAMTSGWSFVDEADFGDQ